MHILQLFVLCSVGLFAIYSLADAENEVIRGAFPFMAFVYYSDKTIVDRTGARLTRGAVLIRPEWLVSSSLEDEQISLAFPKETLVARLGAVRIDSTFSINEDEEEQEREIVQIASPFNFKATEWWLADITLLKTLLPFNISSMVAPAAINPNPATVDKSCFMLIYSAPYPPNDNRSDDKFLMKHTVHMLPPTPETCGSNFVKSSMICAEDSEDLKKEPNFCEGNRGSPLICDNDVVGIQTYINDCKPPHLFQDLKFWENLITCAVEDKCHEEQCATICIFINKDPLEITSQQTLAEARVYPEENFNRSDNGDIEPTSMLRRLLPSILSKTLSDTSFNKEVNTETTTTSSSTVMYNTEKETTINNEIETMTPTLTEHLEDEQEKSTTPFLTTNTDNTETTHYIYKTAELVNKVEELKNLLEENGITEKTQEHKETQETQETQRDLVRNAASMNTRCLCCVMIASLILFYLPFSFIIN